MHLSPGKPPRSHREHGATSSRFAESVSARIKDDARELAAEHTRPFEYLQSVGISKEQMVRKIMERDGIRQGTVCTKDEMNWPTRFLRFDPLRVLGEVWRKGR